MRSEGAGREGCEGVRNEGAGQDGREGVRSEGAGQDGRGGMDRGSVFAGGGGGGARRLRSFSASDLCLIRPDV